MYCTPQKRRITAIFILNGRNIIMHLKYTDPPPPESFVMKGHLLHDTILS